MTPDPAWEDEFNDWYDHEHIPLRMAVTGFLSAQRYRIRGASRYLAVYEMASSNVLQSAAYQHVKDNPSERTDRILRGVTGFTRYVGEEIGGTAAAIDAPFLRAVFSLTIGAFAPGEDEPMVRRFRIISGEPEKWTHLALHYLAQATTESVFEKYGPRHGR